MASSPRNGISIGGARPIARMGLWRACGAEYEAAAFVTNYGSVNAFLVNGFMIMSDTWGPGFRNSSRASYGNVLRIREIGY